MRKLIVGFLLGIAALPIVGLIAANLGLLPTAATAVPPAWERKLAGVALRASVARTSVHARSPIPATEETLLAGMKIFRNGCAGCHGEFGQPSPWGTTSFYPRVPQFSEQPSALTAPEMFLVVKDGIRYSGMGAWGRLLPDRDIWLVVTFVSRIQNLPPSVDAVWKGKPRG